MWSKPWSYKEGLVIGAGLLVIGILLQMAVGAINWSLFACPVNVIVLVVYIIALVAMHLLRKRVYLFGWLSHYSAAVSSLVWVVGMTVIMVLHDVNQALRYSDNLVALAGGRIVAQGAPDDIITSGLLEEVYGVRLSVATIEGKPFVLAV